MKEEEKKVADYLLNENSFTKIFDDEFFL